MEVLDGEFLQETELTSSLVRGGQKRIPYWKILSLLIRFAKSYFLSPPGHGLNVPHDSESESLGLSTPTPRQALPEEAPLLGIIVEDPAEINTESEPLHQPAIVVDSIEQITKMVRSRDSDFLSNNGGVSGIAVAFNTNLIDGIPENENIALRRGPSVGAMETPSQPGFFRILLNHSNNCHIILLILAAGLYTASSVKFSGWNTEWIPRILIVCAVAVFVLAPPLHHFWVLRKRASNLVTDTVTIEVRRGGRTEEVLVSDVVPGDVVCLNEGAAVPGDGLFIGGGGDSLVVSDGLEVPVDEESPFLFYGSTVSHGRGRMLVTAVGINTVLGEAMSKISAGEAARLPLQLDKVRKVSQITCLVVFMLLDAVMILSHGKALLPEVKGNPVETRSITTLIQSILMSPTGEKSWKNVVALLLFGIFEGVPFVIGLAATYWKREMLAGKASLKGVLDWVKMGSATIIVTDKALLSSADVVECFVGGVDTINYSIRDICEEVREAFCDGISTPLVVPSSTGRRVVVVDDPIQNWAAEHLGIKPDVTRKNRKLMKIEKLSSDEEGNRVLMMIKNQTTVVHCKGPAATVLGISKSYYVRNGMIKDLDNNDDEHREGGKRKEFEEKIEEMKNNGLKAVALACGHVAADNETGLIIVAILGVKEQSCAESTKQTLKAFMDAGVKIVAVSGDNDVEGLKQTAIASGIMVEEDEEVISAEELLNPEDNDELREKLGRIRGIYGAAGPSDRLLVIRRLKEQKNAVVAMVGSTTGETPAMKEADVGVAFGDCSTAIFRESSDVIILNRRLSFLPNVALCGRNLYANIQKYIQVEITVTIVGTVVSFITTAWLGSSPITNFHLIWAFSVVTLIGGFALLLEVPRGDLMRKPPKARSEHLVSNPMWRNIAAQSLSHITVLVGFHYKCLESPSPLLQRIATTKDCKSMGFNAYFLLQVFNLVCSRDIERKNLFAGIHRNKWLLLAVVAVLASQAVFDEVAHAAVGDKRLNLKQWCVCLLFGLCSTTFLDFVAKTAWDLFATIKNRLNQAWIT